MSDKHPLSTDVLIHRLLRVAKALDYEAKVEVAGGNPGSAARWRARANTCLQTAGRLRDFTDKYGRDISE